MDSVNEFTLNLPIAYDFVVMLLFGLSFEAFLKRNTAWAIPSLLIYATTGLWYVLEVILYPKNYIEFTPEILEEGYLQVIIFLMAFRCLLPAIANLCIPKESASVRSLSGSLLNADRLLGYLIILWLVLLIYGLSRLDWNLMQALFPAGNRWAPRLWVRGAVEPGVSGFMISAAGYIYTLVCAFFGVLLPLQTEFRSRILTIVLVAISWPGFLLSGTRNAFLAVAMPSFFSYLLVSKQRAWIKLAVTVGLLFILNYLFSVIITFRNIGYEQYLNNLAGGTVLETNIDHEGLNMAKELFYITYFSQQGLLQLQFGMDYIGEMLNFIPRFLWPEKPILGKSYEELRGLYGTATLAAGFIGRGVLNFGPWIGPLAPALLLALWSGFMSRLWVQSSHSVLRLGLFLVSLGITPNLGRDITLLVLWPIMFGYALVRYLEYLNQRKLTNVSAPQ